MDKRLCPVTVVQEYIQRTKDLRQSTSLFISTMKPHKAVARDTISRWFRHAMNKAGIDTKIFTPHSVRAAATSNAVERKVPIQTILDTAGWSTDCVFRKYYQKPVKAVTLQS